MVTYYLDLQMAKRNFEITQQMMELIIDCANSANTTIVSKRNKRTFSVVKRIDEFTLRIRIESRDSINPSRTMSTLTRAAVQNTEFFSLVKDNMYNGLIFSTKLISKENSHILQMEDTDIVSEIVKIFFNKKFSPNERTLVESTAEQLRKIILDYQNEKLNL